MSYQFLKMHGCGNDFLFLDYIRDSDPPYLTKDQIVFACERNFGIGADGLVVLTRSDRADAMWKFYNCDGSEAEMCGNAARCAVRYLADYYCQNRTGDQLVSIETNVGIIKGRPLDNEGHVEVTLFSNANQRFDYDEKVIKTDDDILRLYHIRTGVPHAVIEVKELVKYPINRVGSFLVNHPAFQPEGTNVTFFQKVMGPQIISTTFERGVERETFACGTGALAAAIIYSQLYLQPLPIKVMVPGGELEVDTSPVVKMILLRGPTEYVMSVEMKDLIREFQRPVLFSSGKFASA